MPGLPTEGSSFDDAFAAAAAAPVVDTNVSPAALDVAPDPAVPPAADPAPAASDPDPAAAGGEPAPAAGEPAPADGAEPDPASDPAPAAPAGPTAEEIVAQLAERLKGQQDPAPAPAAKPAPAAQDAPIYTPEELGVLQDYEKNWPDVAAAEALRRRAEYHDMLKYVFHQVQTYVGPALEQLQAIQNNLHTGELKSLVPDYDPQLEEKVAGWIDTQPGYLQVALKQVMQTGTSEEVADLIGRYRAETGAPAPAAAPAAAAPTPPAKAPKAELSGAAKQAAASLAPVSGERSAVPQGEPLDFDNAFAKYAASMPGI